MERQPDASMISFVKGKDVVSVLNGVLGFTSIFFTHLGDLQLAIGALFGAAVADALDGFVARRFSTPTEFGEAIDIADLVSFGAAPGFFVVVWLGYGAVAYVAGFAILIAALLRLARFQVREDNTDGWVGVPITVNGAIYPVVFLVSAPSTVVLVIAFAVSFLNISSISVTKPK